MTKVQFDSIKGDLKYIRDNMQVKGGKPDWGGSGGSGTPGTGGTSGPGPVVVQNPYADIDAAYAKDHKVPPEPLSLDETRTVALAYQALNYRDMNGPGGSFYAPTTPTDKYREEMRIFNVENKRYVTWASLHPEYRR